MYAAVQKESATAEAVLSLCQGGGALSFLMVVKINSYKVEFLLLKKIGSAVFVMFRLIQEESVIQTSAPTESM